MFANQSLLRAQIHLRDAADKALLAYHSGFDVGGKAYHQRRLIEELRAAASALGFDMVEHDDPVTKLFAAAGRVDAIDAEDRDS